MLSDRAETGTLGDVIMAASVSPPRYVVTAQSPQLRGRVPAGPALSRANLMVRFALFLLLGLIAGTAVGLAIFPIELQALLPTTPTTSSTAPSRQEITAVADKYWHTLDAVDAQNELSSYKPEELAALIAAILQETKSSETRTEVAALAQALDLYPSTPPFLALLESPFIMAALLAAMVPIVLGFLLVLLPAWRERRLEQKRLEQAGEFGESDPNAAALRALNDAGEEEMSQETGETGEGTTVPGQDQVSANETPEGLALPPLQPNAPAEETEEDVAEREAQGKEILKDLASLFEEEDSSLSTLEALVKNLPDIDISDLVPKARELVGQLKNFITMRRGSV